jgi:hypothetical protein
MSLSEAGTFIFRLVSLFCVLSILMLSRFRDDCRRGLDWRIYLLTTCTRHSELQVIIALSLISTLYKSPQRPLSLFPACCVFISCFLATASNSGDSSGSRAQVLSSQPSVQCSIELFFTARLSTLNSNIVPSQFSMQSSTELVS